MKLLILLLIGFLYLTSAYAVNDSAILDMFPENNEINKDNFTYTVFIIFIFLVFIALVKKLLGG